MDIAQSMKNWFSKKPEKKTFSTPGYEKEGVLDDLSSTWIFIKNWAEKDLEELRRKNDNPNLNELQTQLIRGKIKKLKNLLELPKKDKGILNS